MAKRSMDDGRRIARRRMADISFAVLVLITLVPVYELLYSPERKEIAEALSAATIFLSGILASFVAIIGAYLGLSTTEILKRPVAPAVEPKPEAKPWEGEGK